MRRVTLLLALSALVFPMAAFANLMFNLQIGPPITAGDFMTGGGFGNRACLTVPITATSCSTPNYFNGQSIGNGMVWRLNLVGPTGRIVLDITSLTNLPGVTGHCNNDSGNPSAHPTCNFSGTVTAFGTKFPGGTFTDSIMGTLTRGPNAVAGSGHAWVLSTLTGTLGNESGVVLPDSSLSVENVQFCRTAQAAQNCGTPGDLGRLRTGFGEATLVVDTTIPEPGTLALLGTGVIGLAGMLRRKCKLGK